MNYIDFLRNEEKLFNAGRGRNKLSQRFFDLLNIEKEKRDRAQQIEFEMLGKAFRAKWKLQQADIKAKNFIGKLEVEDRKRDAHAKILLGVAAIKLAKIDGVMCEDLLSLATEMPSADAEYLRCLLGMNIAG